jgi:hypothetical protein
MPTPTVITDLSTTAASNFPAGSDAPSTIDDVLRAHAAFLASISANTATNGWVSPYLSTAAAATTYLGIGFKGLPTASVATGAFVAADAGKCVYATAGVTIPNSVMAAYDTVIVQNVTGSSITITKSVTTAYNTNVGSTLGATFTLAARGRMSIVFTSATECYVSGNIS